MRVLVLVSALVLFIRVAHGDPAAPLLSTDFGPPVANLRLAVTVDADGATAVFRVQNVGKRRVTFDASYSCSGPSPFSISVGASADALGPGYGFEPAVKGLSRTRETICTVNVPRQATLAPGKTFTVSVPFANKGELRTSKETTFQAHAILYVQGRSADVDVVSPVVKRP